VIRRRGFLIGLGGLSVLAGVAGGWRAGRTTPQEAVITVLRKRLDYLRLDEDGVQRFADDLMARDLVSPVRLRALAAFAPLYNRLSMSGHEGWLQAVRHGEDRVATAFLLSSDFFKNGRNESLVVHYLGFYEPMRNPRGAACNSPFARPLGLDTPGNAVPAWPAEAAAKR
jgi:hypothetical protein